MQLLSEATVTVRQSHTMPKYMYMHDTTPHHLSCTLSLSLALSAEATH